LVVTLWELTTEGGEAKWWWWWWWWKVSNGWEFRVPMRCEKEDRSKNTQIWHADKQSKDSRS